MSKLNKPTLVQTKCIFVLFTLAFMVFGLGAMPAKHADAVCSANPGVSSIIAKAAGSDLYILWEEETGYYDNPSTGNHSLFFKRVADGGNRLEETKNLYRSNSVCSAGSELTLGQDGKGNINIFVLWSAYNKLFFRASNDNGASFGETIDLGVPVSSAYRIVADENNGVYIVFYEANENGGSQIILKRSIDGGKSFNNSVLLDSGNQSQATYSNIGLAVSGENVYAAWSETINDNSCESPLKAECSSILKFVKSPDRGNAFGKLQSISSAGDAPNSTAGSANITCSNSQFENIEASGQNVYLTWLDMNCNLEFVHSGDHGDTFGKAMNLTQEVSLGSNSFLYSSPYLLTLGNNMVYVAWMMGNNTGFGIHLLKSSDGGNHFRPIVSAIPQGFGNRAYPIPEHLAIDKNGQLYFAWSPTTDGRAILFETIAENKTASSGNIMVMSSANTPFFQYYPHLATSDNGYVYVLWFNSTDPASGNVTKQNIEIRVSADRGNTFGEITKVQEVLALPEFGSSSWAVIIMAVAIISVIAFTASRPSGTVR